MSEKLQADVRTVIELPDDLFFFALIPIGVPAEEKESRTQYEEMRVHWESFKAID